MLLLFWAEPGPDTCPPPSRKLLASWRGISAPQQASPPSWFCRAGQHSPQPWRRAEFPTPHCALAPARPGGGGRGWPQLLVALPAPVDGACRGAHVRVSRPSQSSARLPLFPPPSVPSQSMNPFPAPGLLPASCFLSLSSTALPRTSPTGCCPERCQPAAGLSQLTITEPSLWARHWSKHLAQRGRVTCPGPHSWRGAEPGSAPRQCGLGA